MIDRYGCPAREDGRDCDPVSSRTPWECRYCGHQITSEGRLARERDQLLQALARCESVAVDMTRDGETARADIADVAADAYKPHLRLVRELVRDPLPDHIHSGFRGELQIAEYHIKDLERQLDATQKYARLWKIAAKNQRYIAAQHYRAFEHLSAINDKLYLKLYGPDEFEDEDD